MLQDHEVEKYKLQSESTGHPFAIAKLDDLHSTVWDYSIDLDAIEAKQYSEKSKLSGLGHTSDLYPFTGEGKSLEDAFVRVLRSPDDLAAPYTNILHEAIARAVRKK
jgi:hypothetical protein